MTDAFQAVRVTDRVYWVGARDGEVREFHGYRTGRDARGGSITMFGWEPMDRCFVGNLASGAGAGVRRWALPLLGAALLLAAVGCASRHEPQGPEPTPLGTSSDLILVAEGLLRKPSLAEETSFQEDVIKALARTQDPLASAVLLEIVEDPARHSLKPAAAQALGRLREPRAVRPIAEAMARGEVWPERALNAIATIGGEEAVGILTRALDPSSDEPTRLAAANAMDFVQDEKAIRALTAAVDADPSKKVRVAAAGCLAHHGHGEYLALLQEALDDADAKVRREAAVALAFRIELSDVTFPILIRMLSHEDPEVAGWAWETLDKEVNDGSLEWADPPRSPEDGRRKAEDFKRLWAKQRGK